MVSKVKFAVLTASVLTFSTSVYAQLPSTKILTLAIAQTIAQQALASCHADGYKITVLVVDALNAPKVMLRDDGATASSSETAKMKATTAMLYNRPSAPKQTLLAGAAAPVPTIPGTMLVAGGLPIKVGEATIGAIAVSGAPDPEKDAACATAALAKVADQLR